MPPPRPFPAYPKKPRKHGGGARIMIDQRAYYLGQHSSEESYAEYERLRLEHAAGRLKKKAVAPTIGMTLSELIARWFAEDPRGEDHGEVKHTMRACVPLERLFGSLLAKDFESRHLEDVQLSMVKHDWMKPEEFEKRGDWCCGFINAQINRIMALFRWAERKGHVPPGRWQNLKTVSPIKKNDRRVRHAPPVQPVDWEKQVEPALREMFPQVRAMVLVQFHAGMRPGEVVSMRRREVDVNGPDGTWLYVPEEHKGKHRGQTLVKVIGPRGQDALRPWLLKAEPDGFVFPPVRDRKGRGCFTSRSYHQSVREACVAAGVKHFTPYQIRHLAKRISTREFGLDAARAYLGQLSIGATAMYAQQQDVQEAVRVAKKIG